MKIEKIIFKKIELWFVIFLFLVLIIFFSLLLSYSKYTYETGKKINLINNLYNLISDVPIKLVKGFTNNIDLTKSINQKFADKKSGFNIYKDQKFNLLMAISRTNKDDKNMIVELVDLSTYKTIKKYDPYEEIKKITNQFKKHKNNYVLKEVSVIRSPYIDVNLNMYFLSNSEIFFKVDKNSKLLWFNDEFDYHHTFDYDNVNNIIYAIGCDKKTPEYQEIYYYDGYCNDSIVLIDSETGKTIKSFSITNLFINQNLHNYLFIGRKDIPAEDPLHINDVQIVRKNGPFFKNGDVFLSLGHLNMVILVDKDFKNIKWKYSDGLFHQHDIDIINENQIAIFNNNRVYTNKDQVFKHNEIVIYDFQKNYLSSPYREIMKSLNIETISQGLQELTDFGIIIEEQNYGRILMIDDKKELVFEYINKSSTGEEFQVHWSSIIKDKNKIFKIKNAIIN